MDIRNISEIESFNGIDGLTRLLSNNCNSLSYVIQGFESKRHMHKKSDEIYLIVRGHGITYINDESKEIASGDRIVVPKGTYHYFERRGIDTFEMIVLSCPAFDSSDVSF